MGVQKCAHGICKSHSRYRHKEYTKDVKFFTFPFPELNDDLDNKTMKCREWIKTCGRPADQLIRTVNPHGQNAAKTRLKNTTSRCAPGYIKSHT